MSIYDSNLVAATVIKPSVRRTNPVFSKEIFYIYMPAMQAFVETEQGTLVYTEYVKIANSRCFKVMWGDEWNEGMSLLVAHFLTLWAERAAATNTSMSKTVAGIAGMGRPRGVQTSISAGELSKSWDFSLTTLPTEKDNAFYNKTSFGQDYYSRLIQKRSITIAVVI
jgi:hypothetical protein